MPATAGKATIGLGDPVWAHMEGYPWWPGHVVRRDQVILDPGIDEPHVDEGEVLVEFFNDNKRFAAMSLHDVRSFAKRTPAMMNKHYTGRYLPELNGAIDEATEFCKQNGIELWTDGKPKSRPTKPKPTRRNEEEMDAEVGGEQEGRKGKRGKKVISQKSKVSGEAGEEERKSKRPRKQLLQDQADDGEERERERTKRKKKRLSRSEPTRNDHSGNEEGVHSVEREEKPDRRRVKKKHADTDGGDKEEGSALGEREKKPKRRMEEAGPGPRKERRLSQSGSRGRRHGGDGNADNRMAEGGGESKGADGVNRTEDYKTPGAKQETSRQPRRGREDRRGKNESSDKKEGMKGSGSETHGKARRQHARSSDLEVATDGSPGNKGVSGNTKSIGHSEAFDGVPEEEGLAYKSLSPDQLVSVLVAREKEVRSLQLQLWQYRMEDSSRNSPRTVSDLLSILHPAWKAVSDFIAVSQKEKGRETKSKKCKELEVLAVEHLQKLRTVHFETGLLEKSPSIAKRAIKLATMSLQYSVKVSMAFREVILLWAEMAALNRKGEADAGLGLQMQNGHASPKHEADEEDDAGEGSGEKPTEDQEGSKGSKDKRPVKDIDTEDRRPEGKRARASPDQKDESSKEKASSLGNSPASEAKDRERHQSSGNEDGNRVERSPSAGSSQKGTPSKVNSPNEQQSPHEDIDSAQRQQRRQQRVKDFSRDKCITTLAGSIRQLATGEDHKFKSDEKKQHILAKEIESRIVPKREDDEVGYYQAGRKILKALGRLSSADRTRDVDEETGKKNAKVRIALCKCLEDLKAVGGLVKRLSMM